MRRLKTSLRGCEAPEAIFALSSPADCFGFASQRQNKWFLLLPLFLMAACHRHESIEGNAVAIVAPNQLLVSAPALSHLKLAKSEKVDFPEYLTLMGRISPTEDRTTVVPARVSGRIESVYVASGETVRAGQMLAKLFSPDFISAREEYLQSLKQEKAAAGGAEFQALARMARKRLQTIGLTPADIESLATSGEDDPGKPPSLIVRAPRSGAIATKNATVGNLVNLGDTLFTIADLSKVWFLGDLYPEDLPKVKKDQEVIIQGVAGEPPLRGRVSFISPFVDPTVRSIKIRAVIENPNMGLRADMYVQGSLLLSTTKAVVIPTAGSSEAKTRIMCFARSQAARPKAGPRRFVWKRLKSKSEMKIKA